MVWEYIGPLFLKWVIVKCHFLTFFDLSCLWSDLGIVPCAWDIFIKFLLNYLQNIIPRSFYAVDYFTTNIFFSLLYRIRQKLNPYANDKYVFLCLVRRRNFLHHYEMLKKKSGKSFPKCFKRKFSVKQKISYQNIVIYFLIPFSVKRQESRGQKRVNIFFNSSLCCKCIAMIARIFLK